MKIIPRKKRLVIMKFVAEHEDCRVIFGPTWRAWSVIVIGLDARTNQQLLIGRPRTQEAANDLLSSVSRMVSALERGKAIEREKQRKSK